jgi:SAM-dependent methyltransferase
MKNDSITIAVEEHYAAVARGEASGCGGPIEDVARSIGYSDEELRVAGDANLGLGCGNPLALTEIGPGMTVLDLGSGAGFDAFLAWNRVGETGHVIGVDMTDIEKLPVESGTVDYVISNCVINLSADKPAVFREIARVLKPGGRFAVSDIVLLKPLPEALARDISAYVGCKSGASMLTDYLSMALGAGLRDLAIPRIAHGGELMKTLAPEDICSGGSTCCGSTVQITPSADPGQVAKEATAALASIKLHGRK